MQVQSAEKLGKRSLLVMRRMRYILTVAFMTLCLQPAYAQDTVNSYFGIKISTDTLERHLQERMAELNIPGLALSIINGGEVVYYNTFGYADVEEQIPVTDKTIFEGASLSKPVFAFFVMTFVEEGALDLDKPLYEYYPYPDIAYDERYKEITARMVLSHQAGFPNWREDDGGTLRLHFDPGTDYQYSGEGYQFLALVLREIAQTDWAGLEALFQERVAEPLGLEHTAFIQTPYMTANKAEPYDENGTRIDWKDNYWFRRNEDVFVAPASIRSEPTDFSKWMIAVINKELLTEASYAEMLKPHAETAPILEGGIFYTLGFQTPGFPFSNLYVHGGDNVGFEGFFALDTGKDWGFVMLTNSDNGQAFGEQFLYWLITGPNQTAFLVVVGVLAFTLLALIVFGIFIAVRRLFRRVRRRPRPTLG